MSIFQQSTGGQFILKAKLETGQMPVEVCATDINRDGIVDLLSTNLKSGELNFFLGKGNGEFFNYSVFKPS